MSANLPQSTIADPTERPEQLAIPRGRELFTAIGPGLVLAMTFLGTGDLVQSSTSGANYGYALVWTLIISIIARMFIISTIAKYTLMNVAPRAGGVDIWVNIDWGSDIRIYVDYLVVNP